MVVEFIVDKFGKGVKVVEFEGVFGVFVIWEWGLGFYNIVD